jgi:hypothetical protein
MPNPLSLQYYYKYKESEYLEDFISFSCVFLEMLSPQLNIILNVWEYILKIYF